MRVNLLDSIVSIIWQLHADHLLGNNRHGDAGRVKPV